ncbi:cytochrome b [Luteimonas fraxinea]|uniref:Cytochrome b n=1 Tax=Luteimonas fraxinea TaxID=2901869 RepID=A0ABS8UEN2_9GAMM|nr:cytochrome b [Luteimonas fraxinea]MCD9097956.1 cytochrome b [Luteimonas fraxinea]MCD9125477.1 cytochrome b [Luteimonas fraxinea]UHH09312.1 cytochrome b [Luteimonas fraxinea]
MTLRNPPDRWGGVSQLLHWLVVALILTTGILGLVMGDMRNSPTKIEIYALHKSLGLTILALATLRLLWRLYAGAPRAVPGTPRWQDRVASVTHWLLYGLLFAIPLSGWTFNSAAGYPLQWFKLVNLPSLVTRDADLRQLAGNVHELLFWTLVGLALLHASAALYHHIFQRDDTLARMLPRGWLRPRTPTLPLQD